MNYLKFFLSIVFISLLFSACSSESKVRVVADLEKADVLVDGKKLAQIRIGYSTFSLPTGEHKIRVEKYSKDKEWEYISNKTVEIKPDIVNYVEFGTIEKKPTKKRLDRIAKEEADKKAYLASLWNSKDIVEDSELGVIWQDITPNEKYTNTKNMKKYCENLEFAQMKDWRLPNYFEMATALKKDSILKKLYDKGYRPYKTYYSKYDIYKYRNTRYAYFSDGKKISSLCVHNTPKRNQTAKKYNLDKDLLTKYYIDEKNSLIWDKAPYKSLHLSYTEKVCKDDGWRLPSVEELKNLANNKPTNSSFLDRCTKCNLASSTKSNKKFKVGLSSRYKSYNKLVNIKSGKVIDDEFGHFICVKDIK
jgi:hypothetical protein